MLEEAEKLEIDLVVSAFVTRGGEGRQGEKLLIGGLDLPMHSFSGVQKRR